MSEPNATGQGGAREELRQLLEELLREREERLEARISAVNEANVRDVKSLRKDIADGLSELERNVNAASERSAGSTLTVYRLVNERLTEHDRGLAGLRAELRDHAATTRLFQTQALRQLLRLTDERGISRDEDPAFRWRPLESMSRTFGVSREVVRFVLAATFVMSVAFTISACATAKLLAPTIDASDAGRTTGSP